MTVNVGGAVKSGQEQAVAAWVNYLNQLRLDALAARLAELDLNRESALAELSDALGKARELIGSNRGGDKGLHGFLAEISEKGIHNARQLIDGNPADMEWLNDNGPADLRRAGVDIQQKFYQSDGLFSLGAVAKHLKHYPGFLEDGGKYQIPKDQYEAVRYLHGLSEKEAYRQLSANTKYTPAQWRKVNEFFKGSDVRFEDLEPAEIDYAQAQKGTVEGTFREERGRLLEKDRERRDAAYERSRPALAEGAKVTLASAAIEGGTAFVLAVAAKVRAGKGIGDFTAEDWREAFSELGEGSLKGAVRGGGVYALTNFTATPAAVASAVVTASFGVADLLHDYRRGGLSQLELVERAQICCLDASVSAVSSLVGQALIPVPVLGAVIGNTVGTLAYGAVKGACTESERELLAEFERRRDRQAMELGSKYASFAEDLSRDMEAYLGLLEAAFAPDTKAALEGSIELARYFNVPEDEILKSKGEIDNYFMS